MNWEKHPNLEIIASLLIGTAVIALIAFTLCVDMLVLMERAFRAPPCQNDSALVAISAWLILLALVPSLIAQRIALSRQSGRNLAVAVLLPATFWLLYLGATFHDAYLQRQCVARSLSATMRYCHVDPAVWRRSSDGRGNVRLKLVAPGKTDQSWSCLIRWAHWQSNYSIVED